MKDELTHQEIGERFLASGAFDFAAAGQFLAEIGKELTVRDGGLHGIAVGRFNQLACFLAAADLDRFIGLRGAEKLDQALDLG